MAARRRAVEASDWLSPMEKRAEVERLGRLAAELAERALERTAR